MPRAHPYLIITENNCIFLPKNSFKNQVEKSANGGEIL